MTEKRCNDDCEYCPVPDAPPEECNECIKMVAAESPEVERVREEIATELCLYCHEHDDKDGYCTVEAPCKAALTTADTVLAIKGIRVEADDQSWPETDAQDDQLYKDGWYWGQVNGNEAGFVRCV